MKVVPLPREKEATLLPVPKNEVPAEPQPSEKPKKVKEEKPSSSGKKAGKKEKTPSKPKASSGGGC